MNASDLTTTLGPALSAALERKGYAELTAVQEAVLDPALAGRDLRITSQTGSGKTVAIGFALRTLALLPSPAVKGIARPRALVVAPTRELARQVEEDHVAGVLRRGATRRSLRQRAARATATNTARSPSRRPSSSARLDGCWTTSNAAASIRRRFPPSSSTKPIACSTSGSAKSSNKILSKLPEGHRTHLVSATFPRDVRALADRVQDNAAQRSKAMAASARRTPTSLTCIHLVEPRQKSRRARQFAPRESGRPDAGSARTRQGRREHRGRARTHRVRSNVLVRRNGATRSRSRAGGVQERRAKGSRRDRRRGARHRRPRHQPRDPRRRAHERGLVHASAAGARGEPDDVARASSRHARRTRTDGAGFEDVRRPSTRTCPGCRGQASRGGRIDLQYGPHRGKRGAPRPRRAHGGRLAAGRVSRHNPTSKTSWRAASYESATTAARSPATCTPSRRARRIQGRRVVWTVANGVNGSRPSRRRLGPALHPWGAQQGADPRRLLAMVRRRGGIDGKSVGPIHVDRSFSVVGVAMPVADAFARATAKPDPRDPRILIHRDAAEDGPRARPRPPARGAGTELHPSPRPKATSGKPPRRRSDSN